MIKTYSEVEHRDRYRDLTLRIAMTEDAGVAQSLRHLAAFVDPDAPVQGERVSFDVDVKAQFGDRLRRLPQLTPKPPKLKYSPEMPVIAYPTKDAFVLDISGGFVLSSALVCLDDTVLLSDIQFAPDYRVHGAPFSLVDIYRTAGYDPASETAPMVFGHPEILSEDKVYLVLDGRGSRTNFGHFIHDLLFQLPVIDELHAEYGDRLELLVACRADNLTGFPFPMQNYIMERLGLGDITTHLNGRAVRIPHGFVCSRPMALDALHGYSARYSKARIREALGIACRQASGPLYYISRKDGAVARPVANQDEVETILASRNIQAVAGTGASPTEVVDLFAKAGGIVGLHGAGLMNILFADAAAPLVEIAHAPNIWNSIQMCATAWQHPYFKIPNVANQPGVVDCGILKAVLSTIL